MGDAEETATDEPDAASGGTGRKRERSQIEFPYSDLERAVELATVLLREGGQAKIEQTQLAVAMDQSATGGTFRGRLGAARMFGLIETEQGKVGLTPLGLKITDEQTAAAAGAEAFLNIPLYSAMFERYQGYALPPAAAIERQIETLGVPTKQKERARQAFSASAQYAGYIASNGRFSKPTLAARAKEEKSDNGGSGGSGGGSGDGGDGDDDVVKNLHPFIKGLLETLPEPKKEWGVEERVDWLNTAASIFKLIYKGDGAIIVSAKPKTE